MWKQNKHNDNVDSKTNISTSKKMFATMFEDRTSSKGKGLTSSSSSSSIGSTSSTSSISSSSSSSCGKGDKSTGNFVSRLGFKFDVANFDINAVSPTSW